MTWEEEELTETSTQNFTTEEPFTFSTSARDLYPVVLDSDYWNDRDLTIESEKSLGLVMHQVGRKMTLWFHQYFSFSIRGGILSCKGFDQEPYIELVVYSPYSTSIIPCTRLCSSWLAVFLETSVLPLYSNQTKHMLMYDMLIFDANGICVCWLV